MPNSFNIHALLLCSSLLACTLGCSSRIPESGPGPGPAGEIQNLQTGEVISPTPGTTPAPSTGGPAPVTSNAQPGATPAKATGDVLPGGVQLPQK